MSGILYGIGTGCGDPELITIKALKILKKADIIAIPSPNKEKCMAYNIVKQIYPKIDKKPIISIVMPMTKDKIILSESHHNGAKIISSYLDQNLNVAFITIGDPTIYSTYMYIHKIILDLGYMAKIINGVPSFCSVASSLNISLCEGNENLHIISGSYETNEILNLSGTKVIMKSASNLKNIKANLKLKSLQSNDIFMVENCCMKNEKKYFSLSEIPDNLSYFSTIIAKASKN